MNILAKNLLILASAGSGKTFQLGNRVIGLVAKGVAPERIVALTFTRKAAGEFADSVLTKLATAARDSSTAHRLRADLNIPEADFSEALERVVKALPRFTLGTMDSFFAKVVRGFQYELGITGGRFDLIEGPRATAAIDEILSDLLAETLDAAAGEEFVHSFRRATMGKESAKVLEELRSFVQSWQNTYREKSALEWGPPHLAPVNPNDWETQKHTLAERVRRGIDTTVYSRKGQRESMEAAVNSLESHTIGSGSLNKSNALLNSIFEACCGCKGPMTLKSYSVFTFDGPPCDALREMVALAAQCEFASALARTRAVREVITTFDEICDRKLRRRGLLGFADVKLLMGRWALHEDDRLRREAVDFRLDARYDHWLLDEFQDTSGADWNGLSPLIDEAAGEGDGSVFIVGDRKQAIYAWRGGEVGLFDEVQRRFQHNLEIAPLSQSWRSCPAVLSLVNRVCGDSTSMQELFEEAATRWQWQDHESAKPEVTGEARVEVVDGTWEDRLERTASLLSEIGVGARKMTCGILVRSNTKVREVADHLRSAGFDVIEDGQREPAKDHPVGVFIGQLIHWLANPADAFALGVIEMSPLAPSLLERFGSSWSIVWENLSTHASRHGLASLVERIIEPAFASWSEFGRRRAGDLITTLASLDTRGGTTLREAADWLDRLTLSQNPGLAAVQVMTIHKSKGLGFDVVILPEIPGDKIPSSNHFEIVETPDWLSEAPPRWVRDLIPELRAAETSWGQSQRYEAFCLLYVALTRSKRAIHVLLAPSKDNRSDEEKSSLANWLGRSLDSDGRPGIIYQSGSPEWSASVPDLEDKPSILPATPLAPPSPRRSRSTPSSSKNRTTTTAHSASGMAFGSLVHAEFERVSWINEEEPRLSANAAGSLVRDLLHVPEIRSLFTKPHPAVELFREQPVDAILDGKWLTGIIDRLHLHRNAEGAVHLVQVIDFKTDAVEDVAELITRYSPQMQAYQKTMQLAYPSATVECILLSTRCRSIAQL